MFKNKNLLKFLLYIIEHAHVHEEQSFKKQCLGYDFLVNANSEVIGAALKSNEIETVLSVLSSLDDDLQKF